MFIIFFFKKTWLIFKMTFSYSNAQLSNSLLFFWQKYFIYFLLSLITSLLFY